MRMITTAYVEFNPCGKEYAYKTDLDLKQGDLVVVKVKFEFKLVEVTKVEEKVNPKATAWIVDKVNLESFEQRQKEEERKKEIKEQLNEAKKKMDELLVYKMLADTDPEMKKLLDELKSLS